MSDKIDALTSLFDQLNLNEEEIERLISYLKDSLPVTPAFTPGDAVATNNGKGYVHKSVGDTVLVRYKDRYFEEWLDAEGVRARQLDEGELSPQVKVGDLVMYGDTLGIVRQMNNNYCLVYLHPRSSSLWLSSLYVRQVRKV